MAAALSTRSAVGGFKRLIRTSRAVFAGDDFAVVSAREEIRNQFLANRTVSDPTELAKLYAGVDEADQFLRESVMQGKMNHRGSFKAKLSEDNIEMMRSDPEIVVATVDAVDASIAAAEAAAERGCSGPETPAGQ